MRFLKLRKYQNVCAALGLALILVGCGSADRPFSLVGDENPPPPVIPGGGNGGSGSESPPVDGCFINFDAKVVFKLTGKDNALHDSDPISLSKPIPIKVEGDKLTMPGSMFPQFFVTKLSNDGDLQIDPDKTASATGTYDSATGEVKINGFKVIVTILVAGTKDPLGPDPIPFPALDLTTGEVSEQGTGIEVSDQGAVLKDKKLKLVTSMVITKDVPTLGDLDSLSNEAITASFEGTVDNMPEDCVQGGDSGGGSDGGGTDGGDDGGGDDGGAVPEEFALSYDDKTDKGSVDFGSSFVQPIDYLQGEGIQLNCGDTSFRDPINKKLIITNKGDAPLTIESITVGDTDQDPKQCPGQSEFRRGALTPAGTSECEIQEVQLPNNGPIIKFVIPPCTIPAGESNALNVLVTYMPFNYTPTLEGETTEPDTGNLVVTYNGGKQFIFPLKAMTEPDSGDSLSVTKKDSPKIIRNGGLLKFALKKGEAGAEFEYRLNNDSADNWEILDIKVEGEDAPFTVTPPGNMALPAKAGEEPGGSEYFKVKFTPPDPNSVSQSSGTLSIHLKKSTGSELTMTLKLEGTVGIDPVVGKYNLKVDFMTALIDFPGIPEPVESLDFRQFPADQAPKNQVIQFGDALDEQGFFPTSLLPDVFDPLNSNIDGRRRALRIFNASGTEGLGAGDDPSMCTEPTDAELDKPYPANPPNPPPCAYFYMNLTTPEESKGIYDEETGLLTIPNISLQLINPYHKSIAGWPASDPNQPNTLLDTTMTLAMTTGTLDQIYSPEDINIVPDERISEQDLNVSKKKIGKECTGDPVASKDVVPHLRCYLTQDGGFLQGRPVSLRPGETDIRDVVLVGVGRYNSKTDEGESEMPFFLDSSLMFLVIQGRLCPEGKGPEYCDFK